MAGGRSRGRPWLRTVDFAQPSLLAPDQEARLRQVGNDFCALLGARATRELTTSLEIVPLWSRAEPWKVAHHLPAEEAVALTLASEDGGSIFLSLDPTLVALLVERTLGGELDPAVPPRTITSVDRALVTGFVELVAAAYGELWHDATGATAPLLEVAAQRDLALACDPAARTTVVAFEVRIGGTYSVLHLVLPDATVRPIAARLSKPSSRGSGDDAQIATLVRHQVVQANVVVDVHLGKARLTAHQIAALRVGARVRLPTPADADVEIVVEGVPLRRGRLGQHGDRRVVQILRAPGQA